MAFRKRRDALRSILSGASCVRPGSVYDATSIRIAEDLGFEAALTPTGGWCKPHWRDLVTTASRLTACSARKPARRSGAFNMKSVAKRQVASPPNRQPGW